MNTSIKIIVGLVVIAVIAFFILGRHASAPATNQPIATVVYSCDAGKSISATFYNGPTKPATSADQPPTPGGSVALTLSDGRAMTLKQTISADGGRYANTDESFVFWGKGNGALVLENGQQKSYTGCIALAPDQPGISLPVFYSNGSAGISIRLPQGYTPNESYKYQELGPGKDIAGVKFTIPTTTSTGTNLSSDTYLSVEEIPKTTTCSANLFLDGAKAVSVTDGENEYSVASSTGAGAGNRYQEVVYALPGTNPCVAVRYYIHYGVLENYPAGTVQAFDEQALLSEFDAIRRTLVIAQTP
jgi:membrane-bound inhibitor of C-type lysozyme